MSGAANTLIHDPYKTFRFQIVDKAANTTVLGVSKISPLTQNTAVIDYRYGTDTNTKKFAPGQTSYEAITLERGITTDPYFHQWAELLSAATNTTPQYENDFRKDMDLQLCDENGAPKVTFTLLNCWVSEYKALPSLDSSANAIAIESIKLEHEGWTFLDWPASELRGPTNQ
jgi:phage tail-like protein